MKHDSLCPICGEGMLHEQVTLMLRKSNATEKEVPLYSSCCSICGCETATEAQATKNKRLMTDFYKEAEGLLKGSDVKEIRRKFSLTQSQASTIFGGGPTAFAKYEAGDVTQSVAMDRLLRVAAAIPSAFDYLCSLSGIKINKLSEIQPVEIKFSSSAWVLIAADNIKNCSNINFDIEKTMDIYTAPSTSKPKWLEARVA